MKRTLAALLAAFSLLALVSCTARGPEEQQTERQTEQQTQPQTEESKVPEPTSAPDDEGKTKTLFYSEENVIDIYLVAGQSNAVGFSTVVDKAAAYEFAPELKTGFPNVLFAGKVRWDTADSYDSQDFAWCKTRLGLGVGGKMGPEAGMAKALAEVYNETSGKTAGIIKYGHGGTSLLTKVTDSTGPSNKYGTWVPPTYAIEKLGFKYSEYRASMTGALYREFLEVIKDRLFSLRSIVYTNVNIKGLYGMQGENDRNEPDEYAVAFPYFASDIRRDVANIMRSMTGGDDRGAADMPIFVGTISQTQNLEYPRAESVNLEFIAMQKKLPDAVTNCYVVDNSQYAISRYDENTGKVNTDGLGSDQWHWNQADQLEIGYNVGKAFFAPDGK